MARGESRPGHHLPEGKATAEVLKVGQDPSSGIKFLAMAGLAGALIKFCATGLKLWASTAQVARYFGQSTIGYAGINLSPALISVGFIVGLNIALLVFIGGAMFVATVLSLAVFSVLHPSRAARQISTV